MLRPLPGRRAMAELSKREKKERRKEKRKQKEKERRKRERAAAAERREYQRRIDEFKTGYSDPELIRDAHYTNVRRPFRGGGPGSGRRA